MSYLIDSYLNIVPTTVLLQMMISDVSPAAAPAAVDLSLPGNNNNLQMTSQGVNNNK